MLRDTTQLFVELPFLSKLVEMAAQMILPSKVIVFGSRARGDYTPVSDVDIAFYFATREGATHWPEFTLEVEETLPTLLEINLVNTTVATPQLLEQIKKEGICIYDSGKNIQTQKSQ